MNHPISIFLITLFFLFSSCESNDNSNITFSPIKEISTPCKVGGEPNLFVSESGQVYLSWVEYLNDTTDALLFSKLENEKWTAPVTIASGSDWFVNWADFPSLVAYQDDGKSLVVHWLQKRAEGTYDYDVHISQSHDFGKTWNNSFIPHRDSIAAEHGFVSMLPMSDNKIFATWLDGRNTKGEGHDADSHGHGHHGAMTLRSAVFDKNGSISEEQQLDSRICDCCQTSAVQTEQGVIVAYRDRSEREVRDISIVRNVNGIWTEPKTVFDDKWLIAGCPVNGPSLAAKGKNVAIAWFTMKDEQAIVKVAFSTDNGENFSSPISVDDGNPLGRVDIVMIAEDEAVVSWLENGEEEAMIKIARVNKDKKLGEGMTIAQSKSSRQSGFPRMVMHDDEIFFAWTNVVDSLTNIKTGKVNIER